jgi:hypothetical protein
MKRESMTVDDLAALRRAVQSLEHPSLTARITSMVGRPIELIETLLPVSASQAVSKAVGAGLYAALKIALRSMRRIPKPGSDNRHTLERSGVLRPQEPAERVMTKQQPTLPIRKKLSCAVYTRKSSEEGLEQEFNSLDAQRESCESYVASQRTEGWMRSPTTTTMAGSRVAILSALPSSGS